MNGIFHLVPCGSRFIPTNSGAIPHDVVGMNLDLQEVPGFVAGTDC